VTLVGPPGIGKSRLCREIASLADASGGRILRGRCLPYEERSGYQAFPRIVHDISGIFESDPPAAARPKLDVVVRQVVPEDEVEETLRHLLLLLGLAPDDEVPNGALLMFAARRFIECVALGQPTVFVFEDVHWADASELALLGYLSQHTRDAPALLVATARPELLDIEPTWGTGLGAQTTMPLEPLAEGAARSLAEQLVVGVDPARLVDVAGGNPLFLEELAASVAEIGGEELPVTVREAIAARLDALPANARDALLSAAVIGKTFWRGILETVGSIDDADGALATLEARDFVRRDPSSQVAGDAQFTFKHMLIREVAYSTVPRGLRRQRHAAVALYVEEHLSGEALSTILAYHWREAGEPGRAIPYLLDAADAARRSWAKDAAIDLYTRALDLASDEEMRRRIQLQRGFALVELWDYAPAVEDLTAIMPELQGAEKLEALIGLGLAYVWTERHDDVLATAAEALPLAEELGDETAIPAALAMESEGLAMRGEEGDLDRALEVGDRAIELWVPRTHQFALASFLDLHANLMAWLGDHERAAALSQQEYALARDVQSAEALLRGGGHQALALAGLGRHEEAIAIWDELFEVARELGTNRRYLLNYSSLAYRELHDLDEARTRSAEALELSQGMVFSMPLQFAGSDLLWTDLLAGDIGAAQGDWPERWATAERATGWSRWLVAGRLLCARAEIALAAETPESAADWSHRALAVCRRTRRRKYEGRTLTTFGEALVRLGMREDGLAALREAVRIADDLIGPPARWHARAALGRIAYELGEDDEAARAYAKARQLVDAFSATLAPQRAAALATSPVVQEIRSA
jgi:tetratricopeptide (TPR) repeat protein